MLRQITKEQYEAIQEVEKEGDFILWGRIADIFEEKLLTKSEAKEVLDFLDINNKKLRHFVYEQLELRRVF